MARKPRGIFERPVGSGVWWIRYSDQYGKEHREKVGFKSTALAVYQQRKTEIRQGRFEPDHVKGKHKNVTVAEILDGYLESCRARRIKDLAEITTRAAWWLRRFEGRAAKSIAPGDDIEAARKALSEMKPYGHGYTRKAKTLADATINKYFAVLKAAYFLAIRNGKVDKNPVSQVKMLKENNQRIRFLTDDEEARLFSVLPAEYHDMVNLAINTGMRRMELFKLQWADLNFQQRVIRVRESKSGEARSIPMNDTVHGILRGMVRRFDNPYLFPGKEPETREVRNQTSLTHRTDLPKSWEEFLTKAGIQDFKWHDLRHTFASRLVMAGVNLYAVSKLLGHHDIKTTQRYAHLSPDHLHQAVKALDKSNRTGTKTGTQLG